MTDPFELHVDKFTFKVAPDRLYTAEGAWVRTDGSTVTIGLSDFLQQRSGDIAFAEVQPAGTALAAGDIAASIETIKVNIDLASPISGQVVRVNPLLETAPETINQDPYGAGWLYEMKANSWEDEQTKLLTPEAYFIHMKQAVENETGKNV